MALQHLGNRQSSPKPLTPSTPTLTRAVEGDAAAQPAEAHPYRAVTRLRLGMSQLALTASVRTGVQPGQLR